MKSSDVINAAANLIAEKGHHRKYFFKSWQDGPYCAMGAIQRVTHEHGVDNEVQRHVTALNDFAPNGMLAKFNDNEPTEKVLEMMRTAAWTLAERGE